MKDRILGIENELAVIVDGSGPDWSLPALSQADGILGVHKDRLWLLSGGCMYTDCSKIEWASPECRRVRDIVSYSKAAERLTQKLLSCLTGENRYRFFKNNVAPVRDATSSSVRGYVSYGCHENYMTIGIPRVRANTRLYRPLIPFLVTRQVYGGSGWWEGGKTFWRSQRANFLTDVCCETTTSQKSILNTRDESHTNMQAYGRFHLIVGDANMLEHALFLKVGATSLMISLIEEGLLPELALEPEDFKPLGAREVSGPLQAICDVAAVSDLKDRILRVHHLTTSRVRRTSPLELQAEYLNVAEAYVKNTSYPSPEAEWEAKEICSLWSKTLDALYSGDSTYLTGRVDWYTKLRLTESRVEHGARTGSAETPAEIRERFDLLYHETLDDSLYNHLLKKGIAKRIVKERDIERAMVEGPHAAPDRGTRATLRGRAIEAALKAPPGDIRRNATPSWSGVKYLLSPALPAKYAGVSLQDPLRYENASFDAFLETGDPAHLVPDSGERILEQDYGG